MRLFQIFLLLCCRLLVTSAECLWRFWKYTLDMPSCRLPKRPFHIQGFFPPYILNGAKSKKIASSKYLDPLESSRKSAITWGFIRADGGSASGRHLLLLRLARLPSFGVCRRTSKAFGQEGEAEALCFFLFSAFLSLFLSSLPPFSTHIFPPFSLV